MSSPSRMRPVVILPENAMTKADINKLCRNGICVVEAKDPSAVRFCEPPPEGYSVQERAAISLFRYLMRKDIDRSRSRLDIGSLYADFIIKGTPLEYSAPLQIAPAKKK